MAYFQPILQPFGPEVTDGEILGTTPEPDTIRVVPIWSSGQTSIQWLHIITAIFALLTFASYVVPPRWIKGGKGKFADFQRSGILTIILAVISFIMSIVSFAAIFSTVLSAKKALNAIDGINASWPGSAAFWVSQFDKDARLA